MSDSLAPPWTVACQAPFSMGFSKQEYWRGLPCPSPFFFFFGFCKMKAQSLVCKYSVRLDCIVRSWSVVVIKSISHFQLLQPPWTVAHQAPLSMGFPRQEYWNGLKFPPPGDLTNSGIKSVSHALQADSLPIEPPGKPFVLVT